MAQPWSLRDRWPDIPEAADPTRPYGPHSVYELGADLRVPEIPTGNIHRARRTWVLLDQLLTQPAIGAAELSSKAIQNAAAD